MASTIFSYIVRTADGRLGNRFALLLSMICTDTNVHMEHKPYFSLLHNMLDIISMSLVLIQGILVSLLWIQSSVLDGVLRLFVSPPEQKLEMCVQETLVE